MRACAEGARYALNCACVGGAPDVQDNCAQSGRRREQFADDAARVERAGRI
jgi:hypothetical protein